MYFSFNEAQPISWKLLKGLGCCPEEKRSFSHQGPLMHCLRSMNLSNSYFGKLRISPTLQNGRASALSLACQFPLSGFLRNISSKHLQNYVK